jgi:hypothetical protein
MSAREQVAVPSWDDNDPYTMTARLCDDDGIVRGGALHHGDDYTCTGHAHFASEHIRCVSEGHPEGYPADLDAALRAGVADIQVGAAAPIQAALETRPNTDTGSGTDA